MHAISIQLTKDMSSMLSKISALIVESLDKGYALFPSAIKNSVLLLMHLSLEVKSNSTNSNIYLLFFKNYGMII